jgi:hypothetical protein
MGYRISDHIDASVAPDVVMSRILDPHSWIEWQSEIKTIEGPPSLEEGDEVTGDAALVGFQVRGRSEAVVVTGDRFVEDVLVGVRMVVTYDVAPSPAGTVITRTLEADMPRGVAGRVLSLLLRVRLRRMQKRALRELAAQAEAAAPD